MVEIEFGYIKILCEICNKERFVEYLYYKPPNICKDCFYEEKKRKSKLIWPNKISVYVK
jgi:hypothetical protein